MTPDVSDSMTTLTQELEAILTRIKDLETSLQGSSSKVALFCLTHLTSLIWSQRHTTENAYIKLHEKHHPVLSEEEYTQIANILRPHGVSIARMVWGDMSLQEASPVAYIVYRGDIESIVKNEYYKDFPDYFDPKVEKVY